MNHQEYSGWTNYETWNVALWIDNEEGSHLYWREAAQEAWDESDEDQEQREQQAANSLADRLKDEITEAAPDLGCSCYADLLGAALSEVNWYEIALNWLADVDKEVEAAE